MILNQQLTPAEGEQCIKTYHCTSFRSGLSGISSQGYLEVTNKRVVFQAIGRNSIIHNEIPIEDVSGISVFKGNYFSIMHLIRALLLGALIGGFAGGVVALLSSWGVGIIFAWAIAIALLVGGIVVRQRNILRPIFAMASASSFAAMSAGGALGSLLSLYDYYGSSSDFIDVVSSFVSGASSVLASLASLIVGMYVLICLFWYATRKTMSLAVNSRGGSHTPITISGPGGFSMIYSSAARALEAEPGQDAEAVSRELGALIMDIQQRGDTVIEKWQPGLNS